MKLILIYPLDQKPLLNVLYTAYRVCYSSKPVSEILEDIIKGKITKTQIKKFLRERFKTGHTSPLRQIHFVFVIEGVSRVLTAQFNRHTIGVDRCEMSQRYTIPNGYIIPNSINTNELRELGIDIHSGMQSAYEDYRNMTNDFAVKHEDARYVLPIGVQSREQFSISFEAMRHFLDVRMCEMSQWEHREFAWILYKLMRKRFPFLASALGVKCWKNRLGYCDEDKKKHGICKWGKKRPHKRDLMKLWKRRNK